MAATTSNDAEPGCKRPSWTRPGDAVEIEMSGIGTLKVDVIDE